MAIVKMKRLKLLGLLDERDAVLNKLLELGCVEVTQSADKLADPEWAALLHRDTTALSYYRGINTRVSSALQILKKRASLKTGLFIKRRELSADDFFDQKRWESSISVAEDICSKESRIQKLGAERSRLRSELETLTPWAETDIPLDAAGTRDAAVMFGTIPAALSFTDMESRLKTETDGLCELFLSCSDNIQHYFTLICYRPVLEQANAVLREFGYSSFSLKELHGTAAENIAALSGEIAKIEGEIEGCIEDIKDHLGDSADLQVCFDRSVREMAREQSKEKLLATDLIYSLEGWAEADRLDELEDVLAEHCCAWELEDPAEDDTPPTLLKNSKLVSPINMVTEMYSLPAYDGIDPNPLIWGWYVFFFGFMFADMAYGAIIFLVSLLITKIFKPKGGTGRMFKLGQQLGISTLICGIFTGGFFGDAVTQFCSVFLGIDGVRILPQLTILNPLEQPMVVLVVAIAFGVCHLLMGQCIHIYMGFRDHCAIDNLLDVVPWWVLFGGIAMAALGGKTWLIWVGVACLVLTQGRHKEGGVVKKLFGGIVSLYDITSWLGDVLSYARLMALMLATTVIASVVNILGSLAGSYVVFFIVFILGHALNIGINLIGTYVHDARLQYLEYFGKFYKEGGVPFKPLSYSTKYVDVVPDAGK